MTDATTGRRCSRCGAGFDCGRDDPGGCWCAALPALPSDRYDAGGDCLCPACLRAGLAAAGATRHEAR